VRWAKPRQLAGAVWKGQKSWNGVAILARGVEPIVVRTELPGDPDGTQSRYIEAAEPAAERERAEAMIVVGSRLLNLNRRSIGDFAPSSG
jgi:exonuclease III